MSKTIEQLEKELEEYRQLHQQATEMAEIATEETKKAHDQLTMAQHQNDLDRNRIAALELRIAPASSFHTPAPQTNLSNHIQSAVPIDEQTMKNMIIAALTEVSREFDGRLNQMHQIITDDAVVREDRMLQNIQVLITSSINRNTLPCVATGPSGPQNILPVAPISTGPPIPIFNMAASTTSPMILPASTAPVPIPNVLPTNDYDKSVEVEQRKLINPETTPNSIRLWLILYETYSKHPNKLLSMTEAFGEKSLMTLKFMYPDDHIPTDDTGFKDFLNCHFLMTKSLFSDITAATNKVAMKPLLTAALTLDSLHAYLAAFCAALIPFKDDLTKLATDVDCQKTLIKAFANGLPKPFRDILEETSCSTWSSLQKRFREILTPTNVQLATARHLQWKQGKNGTGPQSESTKTSGTTTSPWQEGKRAASVKSATVPTKPLRKPPKSSERSMICKNCRSDQHETMQCPIRTCYNCRDKGDHCVHLQSECKYRIQRENYIETVTQAAGKAAAAKAMQEVYLFYNDEDEDEYSDYSTDAP